MLSFKLLRISFHANSWTGRGRIYNIIFSELSIFFQFLIGYFKVFIFYNRILNFLEPDNPLSTNK